MWKKILGGALLVIIAGLATGGGAVLVGTTLITALKIAGIASAVTTGVIGIKEYTQQKDEKKLKLKIKFRKMENEELKAHIEEITLKHSLLINKQDTTVTLLKTLTEQLQRERKHREDEKNKFYEQEKQLQTITTANSLDKEEEKLDKELEVEIDLGQERPTFKYNC